MTRRTSRLAILAISGIALTATLGACSSSAPTAEVGDCVVVADMVPEDEEEGIDTIPTVDCSEEHDAQVVHVFDLEDGDFPGQQAMGEQAEAECVPAFEDFVGIAYAESSLIIEPLMPSQESWDQANDREVLCFGLLQDGSMTTESWEGAAI